jgi:hypothetical protein
VLVMVNPTVACSPGAPETADVSAVPESELKAVTACAPASAVMMTIATASVVRIPMSYDYHVLGKIG